MKRKTHIQTLFDQINGGDDVDAAAEAQEIAEELLQAANYANGLIRLARQYFPKSVRNSHTFQLLNTGATISKAIHKAEGR